MYASEYIVYRCWVRLVGVRPAAYPSCIGRVSKVSSSMEFPHHKVSINYFDKVLSIIAAQRGCEYLIMFVVHVTVNLQM